MLSCCLIAFTPSSFAQSINYDTANVGKIETIVVYANGGKAKSQAILEKGVNYKIIVTGTFQYDEGERGTQADAQHEENDEPRFVRRNFLAINGSTQNASKGDLSNHTYEYIIHGNGQPLSLHIEDGGYSDNAGYLTVNLYGP